MARIEGVDLPRNKRLDIALTAIYGIGRNKAREIIEVAFGEQAEEMAATRAFRLTDTDIHKIRMVIQEWRESGYYKVEGDLCCEILENIKCLIDIKFYRGLRHCRGLPVRGQRTHTNARTRKGKKRAVVKKK
jgi:small subunit ribosomal protein S13